MTPQKIALTGAHGTGKTSLVKTVAQRLADEGFRVEVTEEIPRLICEHAQDPQFFRRRSNTVLKQALLMQYQVQLELRKLTSAPQFLICDRGLLDHWAYTKYLFATDFSAGGVFDVYERIVADYCHSYSMLFYVPIEFAPKDDGVREGDVRFQREIDNLIRGFIEAHGLHSEVVTGTLSARCERILSLLQR